jgi:hypothetical protein
MDTSLADLSRVFDDVEPCLTQSGPLPDAMNVVANHALRLIDSADAAAISVSQKGAWRTIASTGPLPLKVDSLQYEIGHGPCMDAALTHTTLVADDLAHDPRWPEFGRRAARETGVLSMMSHRMFVQDTGRFIAGLNFYSHRREAFSLAQRTLGTLLANYGALIVSNLQLAHDVEHLNRALDTNRDIGAAIGILMALHKITKQEAFDLLRIASQRSHRKLASIALDVIDTGTLERPA